MSASALRVWRQGQSLTQRAAAEKIGIRQGLLCDYELGKRRPQAANAAKIEAATGIPATSWAAAEAEANASAEG